MSDCDVGGVYTLVLELSRPVTIQVGALGTFEFPEGGYAYVGSALGTGGFSRVERHRRVAAGDHDVRHWHVDHLTGHPETSLVDVVKTPGTDAECAIAAALPEKPIPGFGSSDCDCRSHLAHSSATAALHETVGRVHAGIE